MFNFPWHTPACLPYAALPHSLVVGFAVTVAQADFLKRQPCRSVDAQLVLFNSDNRDGAANPSKTEEWAQGFILDYRSGYTSGPVGVGVDAMGMLGVTLDKRKRPAPR